MTEEIQGQLNLIIQAILAALDSKLHAIGNELVKDAQKMAIERKIEDTHAFREQMTYEIVKDENRIFMKIGSTVSYSPYVLGGKVPSRTPIEPLIGWVERKRLSWVHREGKNQGKLLTVLEMAYMIRGKIMREGIPGRNIVAEVIQNKQQWIFEELNSIQVAI